jgi:hypothetical protein
MEFARLFLIPAQGHAGPPGGLEAVMKWVEEGQAPTKLINRASNRTRPIFPYPELARYKGTGSTDDEANFESYMPR